jgi:hypothetical protein
MVISINQPAYLPWLGYFHRIAVSDLHVVLDHVQFEKNSVTNRNKIRTKEGWSWLTVPVKTKGQFGSLNINKLEITNDTRWAAKHSATIRLNYAKARYFAEHAPFIEHVYSRQWTALNDLMRDITTYMLAAFSITTPVLYSSEMGVEGKKDELIVALCRTVGATTYLSGPLGRDYLREHLFKEAGIRVAYHEYRHPTYQQIYDGFEPYMSALDLLMNCGPQSLKILTNNQKEISV